jgi:hypothetical protein
VFLFKVELMCRWRGEDLKEDELCGLPSLFSKKHLPDFVTEMIETFEKEVEGARGANALTRAVHS